MVDIYPAALQSIYGGTFAIALVQNANTIQSLEFDVVVLAPFLSSHHPIISIIPIILSSTEHCTDSQFLVFTTCQYLQLVTSHNLLYLNTTCDHLQLVTSYILLVQTAYESNQTTDKKTPSHLIKVLLGVQILKCQKADFKGYIIWAAKSTFLLGFSPP